LQVLRRGSLNPLHPTMADRDWPPRFGGSRCIHKADDRKFAAIYRYRIPDPDTELPGVGRLNQGFDFLPPGICRRPLPIAESPANGIILLDPQDNPSLFRIKTQSRTAFPIPFYTGQDCIFSISSLRMVTAEQGKTAPLKSLGTSPGRCTVISAPISFKGAWAAWR